MAVSVKVLQVSGQVRSLCAPADGVYIVDYILRVSLYYVHELSLLSSAGLFGLESANSATDIHGATLCAAYLCTTVCPATRVFSRPS